MAIQYVYNPFSGNFDAIKTGTTGVELSLSTGGTATPTAMDTPLDISVNTAVAFEVIVIGGDLALNEAVHFKISGVIKNIAGTTSIEDAVVVERIAEGANVAVLDATAQANNTNDTLEIMVTDKVLSSAKWSGIAFYSEVSLD
jgi:hypothetical protein